MMSTLSFTAEQQLILDSKATIKIVRAAPGSGKTRVFVEEVRRHLEQWKATAHGLAALSFTNVAQEEIAGRLGGHPPSPHFVGTLDSFVWRFVVRPFGHLAGITKAGAQLVPAPLDDALEHPAVKIGAAAQDKSSIFRLVLQGGTEDLPRVLVKSPYGGFKEVPTGFQNGILQAKRSAWAKSGRLTHGDSQYLAAVLLRGKHGPAIADIVRRRFPVILLDEFQDTGWFLGRALLALVPKTRSVIVGDPDQAIFGFGGADGSLFNDAEALSSAPAYTIRTSQRCAASIATVTAALSRSGDPVHSREGAPPGKTFLLAHQQADATISGDMKKQLASLLEGCAHVAVLARTRAWVRRLAGHDDDRCPLSASVAKRLDIAVRHLHEGESSLAGRVVARDLGSLVLDDESPSVDRLRQAGIDPRTWRQLTHRLLIEAARYKENETWGAWLDRLKAEFKSAAHALKVSVDKRLLGARFKKSAGENEVRKKTVAAGETGSWLYETVHKVKGREFDGVVLYWPKPGGKHKAKCPSDEWWSTAADSEEREVAFVATSRAKSVLILCVHRDTAEALKAKRPQFFAYFDHVNMT